MRIRKHARISALSVSDGSIARHVETTTHNVCELNRSPWDVISEEYHNQVDINDNITGNSAVGVESVDNVAESVASLMQHWEVLKPKEDIQEDDGNNDDDVDKSKKRDNFTKTKKKKKKRIGSINRGNELMGRDYICCNKADGKGWRCRREAKHGHSLCGHHLTQLRSYQNNNNSHSGRKSNTHKATTMSNRVKTSTLYSSSSEFYYYSGFGPLWGKKKRSSELTSSISKSTTIDDDQKLSTDTTFVSSTTRSDFILDNDDLDYEEEDDHDNDDDGKKRVRKPIKARSLKSLL